MSINPNPENRSFFRLENALIFAVYLVAVVVLTTAAESIVAHAMNRAATSLGRFESHPFMRSAASVEMGSTRSSGYFTQSTASSW